jgi:hypothetical protein
MGEKPLLTLNRPTMLLQKLQASPFFGHTILAEGKFVDQLCSNAVISV